MASIYCRNGTWMVAFKDESGKRHDKSFGKGDEAKESAEKFASELSTPPRTKITFGILIEEFLNHLEVSKASEKHIYSWKTVVDSLFIPHFCSDVDISQIDYFTDILPFLNKLQTQPNRFGNIRSNITINQYMVYLQTLFNYAVKREYISKSPLSLWKPLKVVRKDRLITFEDAVKIMDNAVYHISWAIQLVCFLGVRPGKCELFNLKWSDVDYDNNKIKVYSSKTNKVRYINFNEYFAAKLKEHQANSKSEYIVEYEGKPLTTIKRGFATAVKKAGIKYPVKPYDFRHLFATTLITKGADIAAVSKLMGHSRISTTVNSYYESRSEEMAKAVELLPKM